MRNSKYDSPFKLSMLTIGAIGLAAAALLAVVGTGSVPRQAAALPVYSEQTKLPCAQCHLNPAGGAELTDFGKKFQANGHKLPQ
jgi:hypothetical protein